MSTTAFLRAELSAEADAGFTAVATKGAEHEYVHSSGLPVQVDFGSRMGQLCYRVGDVRSHGALSYELLWGQPGGWDYLTEENAARSIDLLPELICTG
jgi:hypothetical protein